MALADLIDQAKLRWRIERDHQELKQEIGLGHYDGRAPGEASTSTIATLAIAAYGYVVSERSLISSSARRRGVDNLWVGELQAVSRWKSPN